MYDLIGDIHGYADRLENLLLKSGYEKLGGTYSHRERKTLFTGDYIDRARKYPKHLLLLSLW